MQLFGLRLPIAPATSACTPRLRHPASSSPHANAPEQFWTHEWETPREWLDALTAFKAQKFVRRIFMLGIPTARVDPKKPKYVEVCRLMTDDSFLTVSACSIGSPGSRKALSPWARSRAVGWVLH